MILGTKLSTQYIDKKAFLRCNESNPIYPLNYSTISYEFHFAPETILGEVRIRFVRILIGLGLTWFTRYWFPEELISPLAKPFLTLPLDSYLVCTQSTEAFPTYLAMSSIACSYFVFPLISHQIWCFFYPQLLWRTKDEIQSIPLFKWFSLLLIPVPNSSPGSSQCLALSILRGCNINKFAHSQVTT